MHAGAMLRMKWFVDNYVDRDRFVKVLDVGSYDVNGSYRQLFSNICTVFGKFPHLSYERRVTAIQTVNQLITQTSQI